MNDCAKCNKPTRLRAMRVTVERRPGVVNWVEHVGPSDCDATEGWECHKFKSDKTEPSPSQIMIHKWNTENPGEESAA